MKRRNLISRTAICLYLVLVAVLFSSCGKVNDYQWEEACEICKEHEGVRYVNIDMWDTRVRCNDGFYRELNGN